MDKSTSQGTSITIHYHRLDGSYNGWYLWAWPDGIPGSLFEFIGEDEYGVLCQLDFQKLINRSRIGLLIKKSRDRWDQGKEETRFIDISKTIPPEIWLLENDPFVYFEPPEIKIHFVSAFADEPRKITITLPYPINIDEEGKVAALSFGLHEKEGGDIPIRAILNNSVLGSKVTFSPLEEGYEILENGVVHFVFDPAQKDPGERLEGSRSIFVLGTHNNWAESEGDPRWRMVWNKKEKYYELYATGLFLDGSVRFKFKENIEDTVKSWFPVELEPPLVLLNLQTRHLTIELENDLDIKKEYYLDKDGGQKIIPRKILTDPGLYYSGDDLGVTYTPHATIFKVFSPMASELSVILYQDLVSPEGLEIRMTQGVNGTWSTKVSGDLRGQYYTLRITCYGKQKEVMDPYCRCACSKIRGILKAPEYRLAPDLGIFYSENSTYFRYYLPKAKNVRIILYKSFHDKEGIEVFLNQNEHGIWEGSIEGVWQEIFYMIYLTYINGVEKEMVDPWAEIIAVGPGRGKIIDWQEINHQIQWQEDMRPPFLGVKPGMDINQPEDAIIYELHIRDFTIAGNSGVINKGLYLGLAETGTRGPSDVKTGLDHLLELGVTHLQIMPVHSFTNWIGREEFHKLPHYQWGYMPVLFNSPEGTYATDPAQETIITEFKQMIKALHRTGLRVILDVVYNHYDNQAPFDHLAPYYYFRMNELGQISNGSGTGNEFNTTYPMAGKLILDSLKFWVNEYHVDGFRFDLMGLIDIETMTEISRELHALDPTILIYGEPWTAASSPLEELNIKGKQKGLGYGVFNDHFRNAVKGHPDTKDPGFVQGFSSEFLAKAVCQGLRGSIDDFTKEPGETINYVTCHDNLVLRDKLEISTPLDESGRKKMVKLAGLMVLTAQGLPFIHSGMEMYRTKQLSSNSYNQPDTINRIDWQWKVDYNDIFRYIQGAVALRKEHPAFRLTSAEEIQKRTEAIIKSEDQIIYILDGLNLPGETWEKIMVLFNGNNSETATFILPDGRWREIRLDSGVPEPGEIFSSSVMVEPTGGLVLYREV